MASLQPPPLLRSQLVSAPPGVGGKAWSLIPHPLCLQDVNGPLRELRPRLCHLRKGPQGYGFNLHSDKSRPGQYIRSVDPGSPAAHSGLRAQDRLIEVPPWRLRGAGCPVCASVPGPFCLCLGPRPPHVCPRRVLPCLRKRVPSPRSSREEGRCWEPELLLLWLPWLVTALMNI